MHCVLVPFNMYMCSAVLHAQSVLVLCAALGGVLCSGYFFVALSG